MSETEKVEIMHFDQAGYIAQGGKLYGVGKKLASLADKIADEGYDAIFLMGVSVLCVALLAIIVGIEKFNLLGLGDASAEVATEGDDDDEF